MAADLTVSVSLVKFVRGAALQSMLDNPEGPVGRAFLGRATLMRDYAREHCPVESAESAGRRHREPGRLRDSIQVYRAPAARPHATALYFMVGSTLVYARRIEFNEKVGGFLRGALAAVEGAEAIEQGGLAPDFSSAVLVA